MFLSLGCSISMQLSNLFQDKFVVYEKVCFEDIESFEEHFALDVGDLDVETIGGLMITKLGVLPKVDDEISLGNMKLKVAVADKRKIKKIGISVSPE